MTVGQPDDRRSRLFADATRLLYADLHNHSLFSDGRGDPEQAFAQLRAAGLDVAALTDHASIPAGELGGLSLVHYPDDDAVALGRLAPHSFDDAEWKRTGELADAHDVPGEFTALRGFEWTEPWLGHVNVWFSETYHPVRTPGTLDGLNDFLRDEEPAALFGYNHPGREPGRLDDFAHEPDLGARMVAIELFNRTHDYLFAGHREGHGSPIVAAFDAGWRAGAIGCSDEHGPFYGLAGRGRTGIWAREFSRAGVREALSARRTFATREVGLRLDAALDGVRMGGVLAPSVGPRHLEVDLAGSSYDGREVELQLLVSDGGLLPLVAWSAATRVGTVLEADVDPGTAAWLLLRVTDPHRASDTPGPAGHPASRWAVAYASPWWSTDPAEPPAARS